MYGTGAVTLNNRGMYLMQYKSKKFYSIPFI